MSIIGSYRLVNALENGSYTSGTLETALATAKTKAEFKGICRDRQLLKRMLSNDVSATAVVNSATAINILLSGDAKVLQNVLPDCYEFLLVICESSTGFSSLLAVPGMVSRLQNSPTALGVINASTVAFSRFPHKFRVLPLNNGTVVTAMAYSPTYGTTVLATTTGISVRNKGQDYFSNITVPTAFSPGSMVSNTSGTIIVATCTATNFIYTSVDGGLNWTRAATSALFNKVIFDPVNSNFVAVGAYNGTWAGIISSTDGTTWNIRTSNVTQNLVDVVYGDGLYVAIGNNGSTNAITISTSTSAATWSSQTHNISTAGTPLLSSIVWGGTGSNKYIAVCTNNTGTSVHNSTYCTVNTGATWTAQSIAGGSGGSDSLSSIVKTSTGYLATSIYQNSLGPNTNTIFSTTGTSGWTVYPVSAVSTNTHTQVFARGLHYVYSTNSGSSDTINNVVTNNNIVSWKPLLNYDATGFTPTSGTTKVFLLPSGIYISSNTLIYTSN